MKGPILISLSKSRKRPATRENPKAILLMYCLMSSGNVLQSFAVTLSCCQNAITSSTCRLMDSSRSSFLMRFIIPLMFPLVNPYPAAPPVNSSHPKLNKPNSTRPANKSLSWIGVKMVGRTFRHTASRSATWLLMFFFMSRGEAKFSLVWM